MNEDSVRKKMAEVLDLMTSDISSIRTGRAQPSVVGDLQVLVYGGQQKLSINELSTITAQDAQTIVIDPWDKSIIGEIKKGIEKANIGLTPNIDGEIIRISVPQVTTEDRQKYVKLLKTKIENGRIMIRQVRADALRDIRKSFDDKELSEDEKFAEEKSLQEIADEFTGKIEEAGKKKEEELLQV